MICPYCNKEAKFIDNKDVYGKRYGNSYMMYICEDCDARVGVHLNNPDRPLGIMANKELRNLRMKCHNKFDGLWKSGYLKRREAYKYLAELMGVGEAHIGQFNKDECLKCLDKLNQ